MTIWGPGQLLREYKAWKRWRFPKGFPPPVQDRSLWARLRSYWGDLKLKALYRQAAEEANAEHPGVQPTRDATPDPRFIADVQSALASCGLVDAPPSGLPPLRATLVSLGHPEQGALAVRDVLLSATAARARGFSADMVLLERRPVDDDQKSLTVFQECMAHSSIKTLYVPEG